MEVRFHHWRRRHRGLASSFQRDVRYISRQPRAQDLAGTNLRSAAPALSILEKDAIKSLRLRGYVTLQ